MIDQPFKIVEDLIRKNYDYDEKIFKNHRYMVIKIFGMKGDYIQLIDELSHYQKISNKMVYDFLYYGIPKNNNGFIKWLKDKKKKLLKADKLDVENIDYISDYFTVNKNIASEYYELYKEKI